MATTMLKRFPEIEVGDKIVGNIGMLEVIYKTSNCISIRENVGGCSAVRLLLAHDGQYEILPKLTTD